MSVLEIWGAEYQENDCLLIKPSARSLLEAICARERCLMQASCRETCSMMFQFSSIFTLTEPVFNSVHTIDPNQPLGLALQVIGSIDGCGRVVVRDSTAAPGTPYPVDLDLEKVLGDMPAKTFKFQRHQQDTWPLSLPPGTSAAEVLDRILRLPSVGSKRFLTTKVDRSVTGEEWHRQCSCRYCIYT